MSVWKNFIGNNNFKFTLEGGLAVRMINKTGVNSIKGYIVRLHSNDNSVEHIPINNPDPMGIIYNAGVPDGGLIWVVISGKADVYYGGNVTAGTFSRACVTADSISAGQAISEALPTPPFATDKHFQEIGHPMESRVGAGLALTNLHFN